MNKNIIIGIVVLVVIAGGWIMLGDKNTNNTEINTEKEGMEALIEQNKDISRSDGELPGWAKKLGAIQPEGLTFVKKASSVTNENVEESLNENFSFEYTGTAEKIMSEAKRLVAQHNGKIEVEKSDYLSAGGNMDENHILSIIARTDDEESTLSYSIMGVKKF